MKYKYLAVALLVQFGAVHSQVCVLPGTCSGAAPTSSPNQIDVRIVIPTAPPTTGGALTCPPGLVPCTGTIVPQCGIQYSAAISTADGAATPGAHPWQAFLVNQTGYTGSGVLLDQYHVLTAAHKVFANVATPSSIQVYLGVWDPNLPIGTQNRTAERIVVHPGFNPTTLNNSIAIIRLNAAVPLGVLPTVNTGCLPAAGTSFVGRRCMVAGWGQSSFVTFDSPVRPQRQVTVPIVGYDVCRASYSQPSALGANVDLFLDPMGEICAGGEANKDACTRDGGSPLMCQDPMTGKFVIAGLVLWGKGCGTVGMYGVYNNVPYYRPWIDATIASLNMG